MVSIRLDPETERRLALVAERRGCSKSSLAREALVEHLDDLEDAFTALDRMRCPGRIYTSEEVKRNLGVVISRPPETD
jgi:RHH-type rel operon transcriptional repressor/antitoxin RelB